MKLINPFTAVVLLLVSSCIEDLEPIEPNFEKVYGHNLSGEPFGFSRNSDGTFLITGWSERTVLDFQIAENDRYGSKNSFLPVIIKIDQQGNEIATRSYPIQDPQYRMSPWPEPTDTEIVEAFIANAIEMPNGNYMATFAAFDNQPALHQGYMVLDQDLYMEKIQLTDDSELEFKKTPFITRGQHKLFKSPTQDEIIMISTQAFVIDPDRFVPLWDTFFYSIYRLSFDGTILDLYDFEDAGALIVQDITMNQHGNLVVLGYKDWNSTKVFVHEIDLNHGEIIAEHEMPGNISTQREILSRDSQTVIHEVAAGRKFSSIIFDEQLNLIDSVAYSPQQFLGPCYVRDFIPNMDGGFYSLTFTCEGSMSVYKLDGSGNEIWRREFERQGRLIGCLMEASDGGVYVLSTREFNSTGTKITLIKIDKNGKI